MKKIMALLLAVCLLAALTACGSTSKSGENETRTLVIAYQGGIGYAPVHIMEYLKLIEKHYDGEITVTYTKLDSGAAINEGIIGGTIDIGCMGLGPAVSGVSNGIPYKVISNLCSQSHGLMSNDPSVTSLRDIGPEDTIALVNTGSFQHILLAMAAEHYESYAFYSIDTWVRSMPVLIIAAITLVVLFVLAWRGGRTYCNTICPVGTILSFFSRFSWLKVHFDTDKCKNCSMCSKNCKAACIDYKTHTVDYSRCVVCGNCIDKCKFGALSYSSPKLKGVRDGQKDAQHNNSVDASKRSFLIASTMVTTAAFAQKKEKLMDGGLAEIEDKVQPDRQTPLTPPGSLSFQNLSTRCTGCQLCVSECPNQVLRPSNDLLHLMQPTMSYEKGYCRSECTRCSEVCPAGAIKPLDDIEKSSIQIGHAVWIKKNCVVLTDEVECGNCARHCPSGAIEMVPLDENNEESPLIPAINESACIGCGACEYVCPSRPFSAIYVEGHEVHKKI